MVSVLGSGRSLNFMGVGGWWGCNEVRLIVWQFKYHDIFKYITLLIVMVEIPVALCAEYMVISVSCNTICSVNRLII